jgi:hypothetical protein
MTTFLKILVLLVLAALALKFAPILMLPIGLLAAGLLTLWATVSVAVVALFTLLLVLAVGLSPIWIPVLALVGLIALCRGGSRRTA